MDKLIDDLNDIFKCGLHNANYIVETTNFVQECLIPEMGNFQCTISLSLAKTYKKSPLQIAKDIVENLPKNNIIENCTIAGLDI